MGRKNNKILVEKKLYIDIYLIGYRAEGESIIFVIYTDDKVDYVGVVDSYEVDGHNITIEILNKLNIKRIDLLCWTHPDKDHSLGIDKLINIVDENSNIVIPYGLERIKDQLKPNILDNYEKINQISIVKQNYSVIEVMQDTKMDRKRVYQHINIKPMDYEFNITALSPHSSINKKRLLSKANKLKINDYSIAFYIRLGVCNFLFAGDIENQSLQRIYFEDIPESYEYVKIPHHASETSEEIFNTIFTEDTINEMACTTTATVGGTRLPNEKIIKRYNTCTKEIYCTDNNMSFINNEMYNNSAHDKGVIYCRFDILNGGKKVDIKLFGSAIEIK